MTEITDDNFLDIMLGDDGSDTSYHPDNTDDQKDEYRYRSTDNYDDNEAMNEDYRSSATSSSSSTSANVLPPSTSNQLSSNYTQKIKDDDAKHTVDMIERDILEAEAALARKHRKRDGSSNEEDNEDNYTNITATSSSLRTVTATRGSTSLNSTTMHNPRSSSSSSSSSSTSSTELHNPSTTAIPRSSTISDERRKQILAELAMQRAKTRGYHTERELRITLQHQQEQQQLKQQQQSQPGKGSTSSSTNTSTHIEAALHTATTAAISNAVEKALASIGLSSSSSTGSTTIANEKNSTTTSGKPPAFASTNDILTSSSSSSIVPPNSSLAHTSTENLTKEQRDNLIMQMVTERRARVMAEAEGNPLLLNASLGKNGILSNTNNVFSSGSNSSSSAIYQSSSSASSSSLPTNDRSQSRSLTTSTPSAISNALNASLASNTPFMPPLPPTVAALQAQAAAAAASASALAAITAATNSAHSIGVGTAVKIQRSVNFKEPAQTPVESNTIMLSSTATKQLISVTKDGNHSSSNPPETGTKTSTTVVPTSTTNTSSTLQPSLSSLSSQTATLSHTFTTQESSVRTAGTNPSPPLPPASPPRPNHHYTDETATSTVKRLSPRHDSLSPRPHTYRAPSSPLSPSRKQPNNSTNTNDTETQSGSANSSKPFRRPTLDELRKERETTLYGECTFRPTVHNLKHTNKTSLVSPTDRSNDDDNNGKPHSRGISMERVEQLATEKQAILEKRERLRKEKEEMEMRDCTFQPRITRSPNRYHNGNENDSDYDSYSDEDSSANDDIGMYRENNYPRTTGPPKVPAPIVMKNTGTTDNTNPRTSALSPNPSIPTNKPNHTTTNPHLPSPPPIGSPLQWETSLSRKYLEKKPAVPSRTSPRATTTATVTNPPVVSPTVPKLPLPIPPPTVPVGGKMPTVRPSLPSVTDTETTSVTSPTLPGNSKPPPVVARLYADAETRKIEKAKTKATIERAQMSSYTFKPAINPISVAIVTKEQETNQTSNKPLHERSTDIQRARAENIHRLRMENILSNPEYTFKPRINEVSERIAIEKAKMNGVPISDDHENTHAGKPVKSTTGTNDIDPATAANDGTKPNDGNGPKKSLPASVASTLRLTREATESQARLEAKRRAAAVAEANQYTFQPRVNPSSERMIEAKLRSMGVLDTKEETDETKKKSSSSAVAHVSKKHNKFFDRQKVMLELQHKHRESLLKELKEQDECVFKPKIGNADEILAHTRPELVTETEEARVQRLAVVEAKHKAQTQAQVAEEYYNQFTFTPEINELSRQRGRAHTVEEHYKNEKGQRIMLRAKAIAEAEFRAKHPFQPTLVAQHPVDSRGNSKEPNELQPPSLAGTGVGVPSTIQRGNQPLRLNIRTDPDHVSQRIAEHLKAKSERIEIAKRLEDVELLKECTFQPEIAPSTRSHAKVKEAIATDGGVVVVRGLGRYLELKELQRKLDEEKIEREKEAFSIKGVPAWNESGVPKPPTQPQPFHLSTAETAAAMASVKERKQQAQGSSTNDGADSNSNRHLHPSTARALLQTALDSEGTSFLLPHTSGSTVTKPSPKRTTNSRIKSPNAEGVRRTIPSGISTNNQTLDTTVPMNITHYPHA